MNSFSCSVLNLSSLPEYIPSQYMSCDCLFMFILVQKVKILEFDRENFKIRAIGYGEPFDLKKHPQGTEVKAITYSNMQVHDKENQHEVFVIIDI